MQLASDAGQWMLSNRPTLRTWSAGKTLRCGLLALILVASLWAAPGREETPLGQNIPLRASLTPPAANAVLKNSTSPLQLANASLGGFLANRSTNLRQTESRGREIPALDATHRLLLIAGFLVLLRFSRIRRLEKILSLD